MGTPTAGTLSTSAASPRRDGESPVVVDARGVARSFDGRGVLHDITLQIRRGEFVALLGRSGSGKSTLLRILAQLDTEHDGDLRVPERRAVAFQDSRLLPWARVLPNVLLGLKDARSRARGEALLAEVGLADHARAWPKTLSGGEQQRVALARALARDPELLLMDEPFGALDALTRIRMHRLLRGLVARHSPGVLLVTHDVDEAVLLADRVIVLTDGHLSLDEPIDLPEVGRRSHPGFTALRSRLLTELGVGDDDH
ncbi:ABC transporter ATP-binding protein [Isoptericola dokdonensis]|jgi:sulfonate transport system ATP-binding protein|uniref:Aliphatic sulfonates import ATP-binding protein SsuB n=1 Tax=Isoptericola dokdonensis DS-3 TaxID=1300344 RepID=A0A161IML7_9MICO|nr:ABC transporter ATP-binding protein [Isoptericola dokdonensis]ANC31870.1 Aliphatic sulfonates import ATP-binding protein SsuB [Isoptericola dokdonensis DS-3]